MVEKQLSTRCPRSAVVDLSSLNLVQWTRMQLEQLVVTLNPGGLISSSYPQGGALTAATHVLLYRCTKSR